MASQPARSRPPAAPRLVPRPRAAEDSRDDAQAECAPSLARKVTAAEVRAELAGALQQHQAGTLKTVEWKELERSLQERIARLPA